MSGSVSAGDNGAFLTFYGEDDKPVLIILKNGLVAYAEGTDLGPIARAFWRAVGHELAESVKRAEKQVEVPEKAARALVDAGWTPPGQVAAAE